MMLLLARHALSNTQIFLCNQGASETKGSRLGDYFCTNHPLKTQAQQVLAIFFLNINTHFSTADRF